MDGIDTDFLEELANVHGSQHSSIWGGFFSIGLNLHTTGDSGVGFSTGQISDVDEGVVEGGEEMDDTEIVLLLLGSGGWWSEVGNLLLLDFDFFLSWLETVNQS